MTEAIRFFLYDTPKVFILLTVIVFVVGIIRSYFSPEKTRKALEGKPLFAGNVMAASLGILTPFCTCSAIPLFIGFVESGIPLGVTFSFLVAAPMINEVALVLLFGLFGWKTALLYASTGLLIAIFSGWVIGKLKVERFVEEWVYEIKAGDFQMEEEKITFTDRIQAGHTAVVDIVSKVWIYIVAGIAVGAAVHGYVPENFMASIMGKDAWWSVPLAVLNRRSALFQRGGHHPDSSGSARKGRSARHRPGLYDVGYRAVASGNDHFKKNYQTAADYNFYQCRRHRHYDCGISV